MARGVRITEVLPVLVLRRAAELLSCMPLEALHKGFSSVGNVSVSR